MYAEEKTKDMLNMSQSHRTDQVSSDALEEAAFRFALDHMK